MVPVHPSSAHPVARRALASLRPALRAVLVAGALVAGCGSGDAGTVATSATAAAAVPDSAVAAAPDDAAADVGLRAGDAAPDVTFATLDGGRPVLGELARRGAVLVSFWASDCRICLGEAPELEALRERYAARGFEVVSVAMPYDRPDFVLETAGALGWNHPVALDIEGVVLAAFEPVPGTPTAFLVGPDDIVLTRWSGAADFPALERTLDALLPPLPPPAG